MRSVKILGLAILLAFVNFSTYAQDAPDLNQEPKKLFKIAEDYLSVLNFKGALPYFLKLYEVEPYNANAAYKIGLCYLNSASEKEKAIPYLQKAILNRDANPNNIGLYKEKRAVHDAVYFLANAFHLAYKLDSAIYYYEMAKSYHDEEYVHIVEQQISMCNKAKELMAAPVDLKIYSLGANVNTKYREHSPVVSADENVLIFTSRNPTSTGDSLNKTEDGDYFEDIYISYKIDAKCKVGCKWTKPVGIGANINTENHEATIGLSADGQKLFIYKDELGDGNIFESDKIGDSWSVPYPLGPTVNSPEMETHASLSGDETTLYFTRESENQGYGGKDIYRVRKLPNGEWGIPQNLGPQVNSKYNEESPFIHPDGVTLFFCSEGHGSMGGFDIFRTQLDEETGQWSEPVNLGYPINTTDDDVSYVLSPDGHRAYYASAAKTSEAVGDMDLYMIEILSPVQVVQAVTVMKGKIDVKDGSEIPADAQIIVTDNETQELIGIYKPNRKTGDYLLILKPEKNYNISFEANNYMYHTENLFVPKGSMYKDIQNHITLNPIEVDAIAILENIFFDSGSDHLKDQSKTELEKLYSLLLNNPKLVVGIVGHTDSKGNDQSNMVLSEKRAQAVVNFLIDKGINKARLHAQGKGETEPIAENQNPDGTWNEENLALNRRIELKILGTDGEVIDIVKNPIKND